ncbi:tetratricopeptide repeat protein [Mesosutterella sp. AGMB02718]|uniref:Tetratricopeptide repeat protein n=1 Tax=Mesosutterella faecium TaxID=2925194 RepID=A0ABT7IKM4_9BURK|nr:tetratricopeptide repeat protein [Mesosutterella sp. AGMB02718]MDL2058924.1 tetratricopeptide repeat protein [Mesosutterella sp. AGMB02718]
MPLAFWRSPCFAISAALAASIAFCPAAGAQPGSSQAAGAAASYPALTSDVLFELIASEVAAQRNLPGSAYATLMKTARDTGNAGIARRAVEIASASRAWREADEALKLWEELSSDPSDKKLAHALEDVRAGRYESAEPALAEALKASSSREQLLGQIVVFFSGADASRAFPVIERLADPSLNEDERPQLPLLLSQLAAQAGEPAKARKFAELAISRSGGNEEVIRQSLIPLAMTNSAEAIPALSAFLKAHPHAVWARLLYARALVLNKEEKEAGEQLQALSVEPLSPAQWFQLGTLSEALGKTDDAFDFYKRSLQTSGPGAGSHLDSARFRLGVVSEARKRPEEAIGWYYKVEKGPHYVPSRLRLAELLAAAGKTDRAAAVLAGTRSEKPGERAALVTAQAQLLDRAGQLQQAYELMKGSAGDLAGQPDFLYDTAMMAEKVNDLEGAEFYLRKVLALRPNSASAYNALGYMLADRGLRLREALGYIEKAARLKPRDPYILDSLGWVHFKLGDLELAERYLKQSIGLRYDPETAAHLAQAYAKAGDLDEARKIVSAGLKRHPDSAPLKKLQESLPPP